MKFFEIKVKQNISKVHNDTSPTFAENLDFSALIKNFADKKARKVNFHQLNTVIILVCRFCATVSVSFLNHKIVSFFLRTYPMCFLLFLLKIS